ncbi:MAG: ADP-ribosylglycohydrolase family protein [Thermoguttaceae bacterium]|nr:ADP-ribosylglycohydrolase family protein [Thermoguttaceae bacterium]MDW8037540.1 ADP-ribosylglycohydrolase family protein [Thermoguttaceae bacterium]
MKHSSCVWKFWWGAITMSLVGGQLWGAEAAKGFRRLSVAEYRDKMKAGWVGQMVGVAWGGPTEFRFRDQLIPPEAVPKWRPQMVNDAFGQDDLYVEMTFLRTLEQYGLDVSIRQAGIDFANTKYPLWCANRAGRNNLRRGIAPPDSSHPKFNRCPNDIDYQIEADYSGLIAPGMPQWAIALGEKFGRLMNYGDGMYAGQFIGAMYAEAFFTEDIEKIIETALQAIPAQSQYAEMVRDMLAWYRENPDDWEKTWQRCQKKYREDPEYQKGSNGGIDCRINGAYVLMGLLYGKRDIEKTIVISMRCGQDSDCNPSSAAGVLFTTMGFSKLPEQYKALDETRQFLHTPYTFPALMEVCEKLAWQILQREGGRIERDSTGQEVFVIPVKEPVPSKLVRSWEPEPIAGSRFTPEEMEKIEFTLEKVFNRDFAPGWQIRNCGEEMDPGLHESWGGKKNVFVTHPLDRQTACTVWRKVSLPAGKKTLLRLTVGHHPQGDWLLVVKVDGRIILEKTIGPQTATQGWATIEVDLSAYAGKEVLVELLNQPTGWAWEAAYWAEIALESK